MAASCASGPSLEPGPSSSLPVCLGIACRSDIKCTSTIISTPTGGKCNSFSSQSSQVVVGETATRAYFVRMNHIEEAERLLSAMMDSVDLSLNTSPSTTSTWSGPHVRRFSDTDHAASALRRLSINGDDRLQRQASGSENHTSPKTAEPPLPPPLKQHQCTSEECAATKLFDTTELLEIVLCFLDTESVLNLRRTSRRWSDTIRSSPTLRLHYFARPHWARLASDFHLLDLKLPGLSIDPGDDLEMGKWLHVSMTSAAARQLCPADAFGRRVRSRSIFEGIRGGLGRSKRKNSEDPWPAAAPSTEDGLLKYESLQVMQPPVLGMQAYLIDPTPFAGPSQPRQEPADPIAFAKIHCEAGVTLGFLAETTRSLLLDTKTSSDTGARTVLYKAIVSFTTPNGTNRRRGTARSVTRFD